MNVVTIGSCGTVIFLEMIVPDWDIWTRYYRPLNEAKFGILADRSAGKRVRLISWRCSADIADDSVLLAQVAISVTDSEIQLCRLIT